MLNSSIVRLVFIGLGISEFQITARSAVSIRSVVAGDNHGWEFSMGNFLGILDSALPVFRSGTALNMNDILFSRSRDGTLALPPPPETPKVCRAYGCANRRSFVSVS